MAKGSEQSLFFRGIYEFEDPSGTLIAAKVPAAGTADLYAGTAVVVKPGQCAILVYKGQVAEAMLSGTHEIKTENVPVLTKLANWKFGFESPLRCELIFVSGQVFLARRWGSPQPIVTDIQGLGAVPLRAFGNFNLAVIDPVRFFTRVMGSRSAFSISDLEEFVQGQLVELLPETLTSLKSLDQIATSYNELSRRLEISANKELKEYGVATPKIQILSILPSKEVIEAMDAKAAIQLIGSQKEYLLYKAASSMGLEKGGTSNDPMQMMLGLMLGKGLLGVDYHEKEAKLAPPAAGVCPSCNTRAESNARFCAQCGRRLP